MYKVFYTSKYFGVFQSGNKDKAFNSGSRCYGHLSKMFFWPVKRRRNNMAHLVTSRHNFKMFREGVKKKPIESVIMIIPRRTPPPSFLENCDRP